MPTNDTTASCFNATNCSAAAGGRGELSLTYSLPMMILVGTILTLMVIATAVGNLLVGIALFRYHALRTVSNCLIGNLALSDFLLAIAVLPLSSVNECLGYWPFGDWMCRAWLLTDVLCCTASIWNLCVIAFDRFTATLYPVWYREARRPRQGALYICVVWLVAAAVCMPPLVGWLGKTYKFDRLTNVHTCMLYQSPAYVMYSASASFFIPFFITFALYLRIFVVLHARMKRMRARRLQKMPAAVSRGRMLLNRFSLGAAFDRRRSASGAGTTADTLTTGVTDEASSKSFFESYSSSKSGDEDDRSPTATVPPQQYPDVSPAVAAAVVYANGTTNGLATSCLLTVGHAKSQPPLDAGELTPDAKPARVALPAKRTGGAAVLRRLNPFAPRRPTSTPHRAHRRRLDQREVRATVRMAVIIACFCGCWLGFFILYVLSSWAPPEWTPSRQLSAFFFWLGYSNSAMNPVLYTIFNDDFRRAFQKILGCRPQRRSVG